MSSNGSTETLQEDVLDLLKPSIRTTVAQLLGFEEETIVSIAEDCLKRNLSRKDIEVQLKDLMAESTQPFLEKLYSDLIPKAKAEKAEKANKRKRTETEDKKDHKRSKESSSSSSRDHRDHRSDREKDRSRDKERDRDSRHAGSASSSSKDKHRDHDRDSHRSDSSSSRTRDKERDDKAKRDEKDSRERDRERDREREREKEREREREKEKAKSASKVSSSSSSKVTTDNSELPASDVPSSSTSTATTPVPAASAKPILDMSSFMKDLAAKKQALQKQLVTQKEDQKGNTMLGKTLQARKLATNQAPSDKDESLDSKEERLKIQALKTQERLAKLNEKKTFVEYGRFIPPPLLLDDKGRELDAMGNLVIKPGSSSATAVATLKANKKLKEAETTGSIQTMTLASETVPTTKKKAHFDSTLAMPKTRTKRSFDFVQAGSILKKAERQRAKAAKAQKEKEDKEKKESGIVTTEGEEQTPAKKKVIEIIPDCEWWDRFLIHPMVSYNEMDKIKYEDVTVYVEHPVLIKPPGEKEPPPMPIYLTKDEQKKLRRRTRMEREKEKQERVLLGLEEPPKPKVKISNLMRVLGSEATADPTQIEQEVRRQMAERVANHEARNQARKLTKDEKKEKKREKLDNDVKRGVHVALFKVNDISDPRHKFKVDVNAREYQLTGCAILYKDKNLVIVEGGAKSIKKFKSMMLKRIDWTKTVESEETQSDETEEKKEESAVKKDASKNKCVLLWEGTILKQNFQQFRFETFPDEEAIRKYLNHRWSEHYWDMCKKHKEEELII